MKIQAEKNIFKNITTTYRDKRVYECTRKAVKKAKIKEGGYYYIPCYR